MNTRLPFYLPLFICSFVALDGAFGGLSNSFTFNGTGNWSIDATAFASSNHTLFAKVPVDSLVEHAFLYASTSFDTGAPPVTLAGTSYTGADWTDLGTTGVLGLHSYRVDVTQQMRTIVGGGSNTVYGLPVSTSDTSKHIDGTTLVIVYSNATELSRNIAIYDGFVAVGGTNVNHAFPNIVTPANSGFESLLSLGIGFSTGGIAQYSTVAINGRRLSSAAGGDDDGRGNGGDYITAGGFGDSPLNPPDPFHIGNSIDYYDDELYNLALGNGVNATPFLGAGQGQVSIFMENPGSHDDLIFFAGLNTVMAVPEPAAISLMFTALVAFGIGFRFFRARMRLACGRGTNCDSIQTLPTQARTWFGQ